MGDKVGLEKQLKRTWIEKNTEKKNANVYKIGNECCRLPIRIE